MSQPNSSWHTVAGSQHIQSALVRQEGGGGLGDQFLNAQDGKGLTATELAEAVLVDLSGCQDENEPASATAATTKAPFLSNASSGVLLPQMITTDTVIDFEDL